MLRLLNATMTTLFAVAAAAEWLGMKVAYQRNRLATRDRDGRRPDRTG